MILFIVQQAETDLENMAKLEEALLQKANVTKPKRQTVKQTQVRRRPVVGPLNSETESMFGFLFQRTINVLTQNDHVRPRPVVGTLNKKAEPNPMVLQARRDSH